jgi:hypothetical protein
MKFDHAWTLAGRPRGETPAPPPGKRTLALPRLPVCRALLRQTGKCIFRAILAVFRAGLRPPLALGEHSSPGLPQLAAQPRRHNPRPSYRPPSHQARLEIWIRQRLSRGARRLACGGRVIPTGLFPLVGGLQKLVRISRTAGCDPSRLGAAHQAVESTAATQPAHATLACCMSTSW